MEGGKGVEQLVRRLSPEQEEMCEVKNFLDWEWNKNTFQNTESILSLVQVVQHFQENGQVYQHRSEFLVDMYNENERAWLQGWVQELHDVQQSDPNFVKYFFLGWDMNNDAEFCHKYFDTLQFQLVDLQQVARGLGYKSLGLQAVVHQLFGAPVNKDFQDSNWHKRPLAPQQLEYAMDDARWVERIYERWEWEIKDNILEWSRQQYEKLWDRTHKWETSGWKLGGEPSELKLLVRWLWEVREFEGKKQNLNVGIVAPRPVLVGKARERYQKWYVETNYGNWGWMGETCLKWTDYEKWAQTGKWEK
jgi:hypothetical protein